ncbi:hypothetical protein FK220_019945 [Flavobacteriaceae bacterium TP-CH-4]|uniref:Uncharacterized protein n=1 Tax=Pelagihabitans pacificus TaxID=2696054 RepID=A0A967AWT5_9FLAO|nr:hypothetical protein [Pelagihabitans pacificus]NHF61628.1 hypothetical protein [Pelagihabitans pacificus]
MEFTASGIPENPTESLAKCLILALKGIENQCEWNLEPDKYIFGFKINGAEYNLSIYKSDGQMDKELISEWTGGFDSIILPIYRGLKKHTSKEFDQADWDEIDKRTLEKLNDVVVKRKIKTA